ncbi:Spc7 multi-domain protein [Pyrenophora tritici-repentis]|nr:Spc7 multi-domain protein [Pyrenophora tritici-repentis]
MMASDQPYAGPKALGFSKYAPQPMKFTFTNQFSSSSTTSVVPTAKNAIATKEQIAASKTNSQVAGNTTQHNPDVELAIAQGTVLKKEVEQHVADLSRTVSDKVVNTRRLLELVREKCPEATNATIDALWVELEGLFAAANDAKAALPEFLHKQRDSLGLHHTALLNETIRETEGELNIVRKKADIQNSLILQGHEAFRLHKTQTESKLKDLETLEERVSRLDLEKGELLTEIDSGSQQLKQERTQLSETKSKLQSLEKELEKLVDSKKQSEAEVAALRKEVAMYTKDDAAVQGTTDGFIAKLKSAADLLAKETDKTKALDAMIVELKEAEDIARLDADKAKKEHAALNTKYSNQTAEHSKLFMKLDEQTKQFNTLTIEVGRLQKHNSELKQRLTKLVDLEKEVIELRQAKASLSKQIDTLTSENEAMTADGRKAQTTLENALNEKKDLEKTVQTLKSEHAKVTSKLKGNAETIQALNFEKAELETAINQLKASMSMSPGGGGSPNPNLEDEMLAQVQKIRDLEHAVDEWTELAKRSYKEYRDLLPLSKQAEQYRQAALDKDDVVKNLELQLATVKAKASQSTGAGPTGGDARYWKSKYETLLANVGA